MIVRDSAGIWQARCLERRPTLWLPFSGPARCEVGKFHWAVHSMAPQSWLQAPANSWRDRAATQVCGKPGQPFRVIVTEQDKPGDHTKSKASREVARALVGKEHLKCPLPCERKGKGGETFRRPIKPMPSLLKTKMLVGTFSTHFCLNFCQMHSQSSLVSRVR